MTSPPDRLISLREQGLRRFFKQLPVAPDLGHPKATIVAGIALATSSLIFWLGAEGEIGRIALGSILLLAGCFVVLRAFWAILRARHAYEAELRACFPRPSAGEVDAWLAEALARIRNHSLEKLGLSVEDCTHADVPPILAPLTWLKSGVSPDDIVWITGSDGKARFGAYGIAFLWFADSRLGIFSCDYSLLRDSILNEDHRELYYQDISSISMKEVATSLSLPSGVSLIDTQEVEITVANSTYFSFTVGTRQLKQLTGAAYIPDSGAALVVSALRTKLRDVKEFARSVTSAPTRAAR